MAGLSDTLSRFDVSGEILNEDTIGLLSQPDPKIPGAEMNLGDCAAAFELLSEVWQEIRADVSNFDTEKIRKKWLGPVFELLGQDLTYLRSHTDFAQRSSIPLTHRNQTNLPVWMLDYGQSLDDKPIEARIRQSPHEIFQEYLDLTNDTWGILTNGRTLRLLNDYHKSLTRNFVEVDLESVFESLDFDAFRAIWRIFHGNAFKPGAKGVLPIERLRDFSRQEGTEIGKELRFQVLEAIKVLGNGFLQADVSGTLNQALKEQPGALMTYYRSLLRIVYRLLFLLYIDNKPNWTPARDRVWSSSYSISRLRREAEDAAAVDGKFFFARAHSEDHWEGLKVVFQLIREGCNEFEAEIHPYGGDLFADESLWLLKDASLYNQDLLKAIRLLTVFERRARGRQRQIYRVNFRNLRIDALGSVYEALLDIAPVLKDDGSFEFGEGAERKLSGTYYTPPALVSEIVKAALLPVIEGRLKGIADSEQESVLLNLKVVDPACGSGAFLIQAMDALAAKLCAIRYHGESPTDEQLRAARRDVVTQCIHGVDLNPMAIELCKFTLWLHVAHPELPLSYLEPVILCGNALVGVPLKAQVEREKNRLAQERELVRNRTGLTERQKRSELKKLEYVGWPDSILDEAFNAVAGDDADIAKLLKRRNKDEREGQPSLPFHREEAQRELRAQKYLKFKQLSEDNIEAQRQKRELYERWRSDEDTKRQLFEADFWCSSFFWRSEDDAEAPTHHRFREIKDQNVNAKPVSYWYDDLTQQVRELARLPEPGDPQSSGIGFFHWELEFPDVAEQGGFDCIVSNPPWERINLKEDEFFAQKSPEIASASNKAARRRLILGLQDSEPALWYEYSRALRDSDTLDCFLRNSGRFPLSATGDINTYPIFTELSRDLLGQDSLAGIVVPTGIATDDTTKNLFGDFVTTRSLRSLFGFENEEFIFPAVHHAFKFCCLTLSCRGASAAAKYAFLCRRLKDLDDELRVFTLTPAELSLINPNSNTCPIFRTTSDAELTKSIHRAFPAMDSPQHGNNPWQVNMRRMFHMSDDAELFLTAEQLETSGCEPRSNQMVMGNQSWVPLMEAKLFHQFDHRFATYMGATQENLNAGILPQASPEQKQDPEFSTLPKYWVSKDDVLAWAGESQKTYLLGFRKITSSISARTGIFSLLPLVGAGDSMLFIEVGDHFPPNLTLCFLSMLNSIVFDYVLRQKIGGNNLTFHVLRQTPVLPPTAFDGAIGQEIALRAIELVYTSNDMRGAAASFGFKGDPFSFDESRRARLRAELDAQIARLYGINRKQLRYILDPMGLSDAELEDITSDWEDPTCSGPHLLPEHPTTTFPGETFRVLKEKETAKYGEYRTRRLILDAWEQLI